MKKVIIVTGASRGIGAATARLAAQRRYAVCVNYLRDHEAARRVVGEIQQAGGSALAVAADVSVELEVVRCFHHEEIAVCPQPSFGISLAKTPRRKDRRMGKASISSHWNPSSPNLASLRLGERKIRVGMDWLLTFASVRQRSSPGMTWNE